MSSLKFQETLIFEKLFDRGGYVLNFSDRTFSEFFRENNIDIDDPKYKYNGQSKMKRLKAFWKIEPDEIVGKILDRLLLYAITSEKVENEDEIKAKNIINRLLGKETPLDINKRTPDNKSEEEFLNVEFSSFDFKKLNFDSVFEEIITQRIDEIKTSLKYKAPLAVIFLCGSTLEGLLFDLATKNIENFNKSQSSPKDKDGKVLKLPLWTLENLINVAYELELIEFDIKQFSHNLKTFRNFIHPREQASQNFSPDMHTAKISWQVLQATIASLAGERK